MEALFADSIDPGQRSKIFTWKYGLVQAACAIGPLCSVVMFWVLGNEWQLEACQYVIVAGLVLALFSSVLCFWFDDEKTHLTLSPATRAVVRRVTVKRRRKIEEEKRRQGLLGEQRSRSCTVLLEGEEEEREEEVVEDLTSVIFKNAFGRGVGGVSSALTVPLLQPNEDKEEEEEEEEEGEGQQRRVAVAVESRKCCLGCTARRGTFCFTNYLPSIIVLTDVCFGLASGMSVRFFPLFFMDTYNLSPMAVSGIYVLSPLLTSLASFLAQRTSHHLGRVSTTITCKLLGVSLLFLMCFLDYHHVSAFAVIPVYILRTALMNSTKPLTRSIIMDAVPKEDRGKWNSLESVTMATWSGSAVLGGLLVDEYGFLFNNLITASLQLLSTLPLFLVLGLVPCEKNGGGKVKEEEEEEEDDDDEDEEEEEEAGMDSSDGSVLGASFSKFFFGAAPPPPGGAGDLEGGREGEVDGENVNAAWEKQLREQLARFKEGRGGGREEEMELPLEREEDLARLERILKRGRSRAGTVEDVEL
jgi:MFS family permease